MWDWVLLVVAVVTALYWYLTWNFHYWRTRGVYTLPGVFPGAGHTRDALTFKKSQQWLYCEIYNQTKGHPAVGIYSFRRPALLVRDLSLVQTVLVSDFSSFHDNNVPQLDETIDPHASKNPFVLKGQRWKSLRQKLSPAFSNVRIKNMFPLMQSVCRDFNNYMDSHLLQEINVNHLTGLFTSEVVARCAFAIEGNAFNDEKAEFYQQGRKLWFFSKEIIDFFTDLIKQAADYRNKNPDKVPEDYLQYLFSLTKKDPDFTLDDVVAQSLTFFTDGFETSSFVASFVIYELTMNPHIQEQLRKDVKAMDSFSYENITNLSLLDRVFTETMRKYSIFSLEKESTKDTVLQADGLSYPVSKGDTVILPVYGIHHDPDIYPDPEVFDPDRFLPENIKKRHPVAFLGFGTGPRMCIGYKIGTIQVKVLIANILANFRLLKCDKTAEKMVLMPNLFFPVSDKGIWVQFQKL